MENNENSYYEFSTSAELLSEPHASYNREKDFTTLRAWRKSRIVKLFFYKKILMLIPDYEKFNLHNQIRKSAVSITANIAEGYGRYHYQEGIQFYRISRGSLYSPSVILN